jgi:hypothetical protein
MELPSSNSSVETQFRKGFLGLLETLRFSVVLLHNELGRQAPAAVTTKENEQSPDVLELMEGKNNFITRIEHLKHNVAYHPGIHLKEMKDMIQEFDKLKTDIVEVLQSKIASPHANPATLFGRGDVLKKSINQINQNWIKLEGNTLQIHTATIPEEVHANKLSSGTHTRAAKRS